MPLYDYICGNCGERTEVMHSVHAESPDTCPACGLGPLKKALNPPAIHFKGTGWAKKERASASVPKAAGARPAEPGDVSGGDGSGAGSGAGSASGGGSGPGGGEAAPAPAPSAAPASGASEG